MKKIHLLAAVSAIALGLVSCSKTPEVPAEVSVSPNSVTFASEGETLKVAVTTNKETYSVADVPEWISVAKSGNELALTAQANLVNEERKATITITSEEASCKLEVIQKPGSPYPGFQMMKSCEFEYSGTMLYQFLKMPEEYDGGQGYLIMADEDGNTLTAWIYTDLFLTEDDVVFTTGKYTLGQDCYPNIYAKKMTFMGGSTTTISDDEGDETFTWGTYYEEAATGKVSLIKTGEIEVFEGEDGTTVKADLVDSDGNSLKFVYVGEVPVDTEGAAYPSDSDHIDVGNTVFAADCYYLGDSDGKTKLDLMIYSGDQENYATTTYELLVDPFEFTTNYDLSGTYAFPSDGEDEEEESETPKGSIVPGSLMEIGDFSFPMGTYVMYTFGDYLIADSFASLILTKKDNGKYNIMGAIMSDSSDEFVMFMNVEVEISFLDGRDSGDDEED